MLMEVFTDLSQFTVPAAIIGGILFVLGLLLKANAKKETASSVISTLMLSVGVVFLLFAAANWVSKAFEDWGFFSDRML